MRLRIHREHDPKASLPGHHAIVGFRGARQWESLDHGAHTGECGKLQCVFRVDGGTGSPPLYGSFAGDQYSRWNFDRSMDAPITISFPFGASPPTNPDIALPLGAVERMALLPPNFCNSWAGSDFSESI